MRHADRFNYVCKDRYFRHMAFVGLLSLEYKKNTGTTLLVNGNTVGCIVNLLHFSMGSATAASGHFNV
jgi:hypothetical protein